MGNHCDDFEHESFPTSSVIILEAALGHCVKVSSYVAMILTQIEISCIVLLSMTDLTKIWKANEVLGVIKPKHDEFLPTVLVSLRMRQAKTSKDSYEENDE